MIHLYCIRFRQKMMPAVILLCLVFAPSAFSENTVGMRGHMGLLSTFGKVGSQPFFGDPIFIGKNYEWGMQFFSTLSLTEDIYIEPQFGFLKQDILLKYEGIVNNKSGKTEIGDTTYDHWIKNYVTFGLAFKGKTPLLKKRIRFSATLGFELMRAAKFSIGGCGDYALCPFQASFSQAAAIYRGQYLGKNQSVGGQTEETSQTVESEAALPANFTPWGFRMFYGMGMEIYFKKLRGVIFEVNLLAGNDLTNLLFQDTVINPNDLRESRFDFFGQLSLGVAYRIPEKRLPRGVRATKEEKVKRSDLDEDEEEE